MRRKIAVMALVVLGVAVAAAHSAFFQGAVNGGAAAPICSDSTPAVAAAVGFSVCSFSDPMTSVATVDQNQTNLAGYNWYTQQQYCYVEFVGGTNGGTSTVVVTSVVFQNSCGGTSATLIAEETIGAGATSQASSDIPTAGTVLGSQVSGTTGLTGTYNISGNSNVIPAGTKLNASFQQPASTFSFNGSTGMEMSNCCAGGGGVGSNNFSISSTAQLEGSTAHGISFVHGMYWRNYFAVNESLANAGCTSGLQNCRWPAEWMTNFSGGSTPVGFEVDNLDMTMGPSGTLDLLQHLHAYGTPVGTIDSSLNNSSRSQMCNPSLNGTAFHQIDTLWVPSSNSFLGGMGLWVWFFDTDTCSGAYSIGNASFSGTAMTVNALTAGTIVAGQWLACNGCGGGLTVLSGSGSTWTVSSNVGTLTGVGFIGSNMEGCPYFLSANTPCPIGGSNTSGAFSYAETSGNGMQMIMSAACRSTTVSTPASTGQCDGAMTNAFPIFHKNQQVWQTSLVDKVVQ